MALCAARRGVNAGRAPPSQAGDTVSTGYLPALGEPRRGGLRPSEKREQRSFKKWIFFFFFAREVKFQPLTPAAELQGPVVQALAVRSPAVTKQLR